MTQTQTAISELSDQQLLSLAKEDHHDALSLIHDRYYPQIWRYVCFRLHEAVVCEDIVSEVFYQLIKTLKTKKRTIKELRGWLFGTTNHMVMDHWRKNYRRRLTVLSDEMKSSDNGNPQEDTEAIVQLEVLKQLLNELSNEYQHVLVLRFVNGFSLDDTAQTMHKSVGAVKVMQYRAVNQLRKRLLQNGWTAQ